MSSQIHFRSNSGIDGVEGAELEQSAGGMQTPKFARWRFATKDGAPAECEQSQMHAFIAGEASKSRVASASPRSAVAGV